MLTQHRTRQLEARLKAGRAWEESSFVFCNGHGGFLEPSQLHMMFRSLLEDAGLPQLALAELPGLLEHLIDQRRLAVIDVGDNGNIA